MFDALRRELDLPPAERTAAFPAGVLTEAERVVAQVRAGTLDRSDRTDLAFVTVDPPGAMDLDQAVHLERRGDGFRVHYAIADLGVLPLDGAIDTEARRRGQTIYLPDGRVPLHPPALSEDALSLLPDRERPAVLWSIDLDADGAVTKHRVERALVRSRARFDYATVQADADAGRLHPSLEALPDVGRLRRGQRVAAGALELGLPDQEIVPDGDGWRIAWRERRPADDWNAELSLLTGMVAAAMMVQARVGLLRTLPPAAPEDVRRFLRRAGALGVEAGDDPAALLDRLDGGDVRHLAVMTDATRLLRGASYQAFDGELPDQTWHAGVGGEYAQVTAPLRRLADRFASEVCLALAEKGTVPAALREALPSIPGLMSSSDSVASRAERGALDRVEAAMLQPFVGRVLDVLVVDVEGDRADVMLVDPPVLATVETTPGGPAPAEGERARARVGEADPESGVVRLAFAS